MYDLHHIARLVLHQIEEEHRISDYDQEASISHGPSFRPSVSSTLIRMQPIRGRSKGRVDRRGRGRDGEGGRGTHESTFPTSILSHTYPLPDTSILPHTYPSPDTFIPPHTYTSPSIPPDTYTFLPSPMSPEPASIAIDITLSSYPLSSPTLPPIDETMVDLV